MLVAKDRHGRLVNAVHQEIKRNQAPFTCPGCLGQARFKKGKINRPHFAHVTREQCTFFAENESAEHLNLKGHLYRWASKSKTSHVTLEECLPDIGQIADVMLNGHLALEVQCSSLSQDRLKERSDHYRFSGHEVIWLLGRKLWLKETLTKLQRGFLYFSKNCGFYLWELDEANSVLRLKYMIHEDLCGKLQYLTKEFRFGEGDLMTCLRFPFQAQSLHSFEGKMNHSIVSYVRQQLYFQNPRWMAKQAEAYRQGHNLLTYSSEDFYPQVNPISSDGLTQISQDLDTYYHQFHSYYISRKAKHYQILYSPAFYDRIKGTEDFTNGKK
ncbi:competence protein CoiA [Streptococcus moroccensis]|uniref:Competence protein CoiA n=1 Tax=Streptococcus moroccensis TaxID=1451356 RepID=A0ABT9YQ77_9STRE|nr:competence protein CoiA family protein [Streptococcus moroccensis]MDQ0222146.1 competence protein CoiA [Streptococcus moroccensis]